MSECAIHGAIVGVQRRFRSRRGAEIDRPDMAMSKNSGGIRKILVGLGHQRADLLAEIGDTVVSKPVKTRPNLGRSPCEAGEAVTSNDRAPTKRTLRQLYPPQTSTQKGNLEVRAKDLEEWGRISQKSEAGFQV